MRDENDMRCLVLVESDTLKLIDKHILKEQALGLCLCIIDDNHFVLG